MKSLMTVLLLSVAVLTRADEIEPAVNTSSVAPAAPAATVPETTAPASEPAAKATTPTKAAPAKQAAGQKSNSRDEILLDPTQITGNRELPNVMYVVPWKRPDLGDLGGRPAKSLINEVLAPVDRDVFRRQNRYFAALQAPSAPAPAKPTVAPAAGATITLPSKDEK
ncbi:MAG TPA: hypothetical protein VGN77_01270 [Steroidobacteraceae bacterium]|nr:hypothetical protein [Steroidobacteraceae bacterium]